jgi:cytosine/adenosine deaminase-related metal-dependent hydrolase
VAARDVVIHESITHDHTERYCFHGRSAPALRPMGDSHSRRTDREDRDEWRCTADDVSVCRCGRCVRQDHPAGVRRTTYPWRIFSSSICHCAVADESVGQRSGYELAYFAALRHGVTALSEYGFDRLAMPVVAATDAFRRTDIFGVVGIHNGEQADVARKTKRPSLKYSVALPDADSLTTYSLQTRLRLAREEQWGISMALAENRRDAESIRRNFQRSIIQLAQEHGLLVPPLLVAHLAYVEPGDVELLAKAKLPIIVNSSGSLMKATEFPSLAELIRGQVPLALCTDWGVADPLSNVRSYMSTVRMLGLTIPKPETLLAMITSIPARALGIHDEIGTLEPGKRANMIFLDINDFQFGSGLLRRASDVLLNILLNASADRVTEVMINGEFYMRNGELMTISSEDLAVNTKSLLERLLGPLKSESDLAIVERPAESPSPGGTDDLPFEEGFRVLRKGEGAERIFQLPDRLEPGPELPKDVKKVFGEDDPE